MRIVPSRTGSQAASTLVVVLLTGAVVTITLAGMLSLSGTGYKGASDREDWTAAFYHAENAMQWAAQSIADVNPVGSSNYFSTAAGNLSLPYLGDLKADSLARFKGAWASAVRTNSSLPNIFLVTSSAKVGQKVRTLQAVINRAPPSQIFDYEYFLNNWGWWWGGSITGNGPNRSNWDFDFRDSPVVNGLILANGLVTQNSVPVDPFGGTAPFVGAASTDVISMVHPGVPRLEMPNLKDFAYYTANALSSPKNKLWVGNTVVVAGAHANAAQPGLYLVGTDAAPIIISNTVVVPGDVVIKGKVSGQGTLYVGGNLYIAGDVTYKNGPPWATPPESMAPADRDKWVQNNKNKDLVAFAVKGHVLGGDVTSLDWKKWCYDPADYGLKNVSDEKHLGQDGILNTPDDNVPYVHADGSKSTGYDADGDGEINGPLIYETQLNMSQSRAATISGYPTDSKTSKPISYDTVATSGIGTVEGIFYTNHGFALRMTTSSSIFHGVVISRNEAIIYNNHCTFNYDSRVHSRYNGDQNKFVDLGLPVAGGLRLTKFAELPAMEANL